VTAKKLIGWGSIVTHYHGVFYDKPKSEKRKRGQEKEGKEGSGKEGSKRGVILCLTLLAEMHRIGDRIIYGSQHNYIRF
jgi:hypothetical protein